MTLSTFNISDVLQKLADQEGISVEIDGIDDTCYGLLISSDKTFVNFLTQHAGPYNFQIIDGDPVRIVRRAVNDDLTIDLDVNQTDCVVLTGTTGQGAPAVKFQRVDRSTLPRQVEVQYYDPDRGFAITSQFARNPAAPRQNAQMTVNLDFVISADQARSIAYDYLFRMWAQQLSLSYELKSMSVAYAVEPGDVHQVTCDQGIFTVLVQDVNYTPARTAVVSAFILLSSAGFDATGGTADPLPINNIDFETTNWLMTTL